MVDLVGQKWTKIQKSQAHKAHKSPSEQGSKKGLRGLQLSPSPRTKLEAHMHKRASSLDIPS